MTTPVYRSRPARSAEEGTARAESERLWTEADHLHRALFGREAPEEVRQRYADVMRQAPLAEIPRCNVARLMERGVDVEALELALRRKHPVNSLTQRFHVLCFLVEVRPEYFDRFVSEHRAPATGVLALTLHSFRSLYKLAKGALLLRIHNGG